jgi:hypothetical protein
MKLARNLANLAAVGMTAAALLPREAEATKVPITVFADEFGYIT